jgi:hypothetical protein
MLGGYVVGQFAPTGDNTNLAMLIAMTTMLYGAAYGFLLSCGMVVVVRTWQIVSQRVRYLLVACAIPVVLATIVFIPWPYREQSYRGDGQIEDLGYWSYPRYQLRLPRVVVSQPRVYTFRCSSLPPEPLTLKLHFSDASHSYLPAPLPTQIDVRITRKRGLNDEELVGQATGTLADWTLTSPSFEYWHASLRDIPVSRGAAYTVTVRTSGVDHVSTSLEVEPILCGGGHELP